MQTDAMISTLSERDTMDKLGKPLKERLKGLAAIMPTAKEALERIEELEGQLDEINERDESNDGH